MDELKVQKIKSEFKNISHKHTGINIYIYFLVCYIYESSFLPSGRKCNARDCEFIEFGVICSAFLIHLFIYF